MGPGDSRNLVHHTTWFSLTSGFRWFQNVSRLLWQPTTFPESVRRFIPLLNKQELLCARVQNVQTDARHQGPVCERISCTCTGHTLKYMTRTGNSVPFLSAGGLRDAPCLSTIFTEPVRAAFIRSPAIFQPQRSCSLKQYFQPWIHTDKKNNNFNDYKFLWQSHLGSRSRHILMRWVVQSLRSLSINH